MAGSQSREKRRDGMDLEKRVELLEQELQILKNQIQNTLLGIQEQLLTNAYPSLRAEDVPARSRVVPDALVQVPVVALPAAAAPAGDDAEDLPKVRRVSLRDLEAPTPDRATQPPKRSPQPQRGPQSERAAQSGRSPQPQRAAQSERAGGTPSPKSSGTPPRKPEQESRPAPAAVHQDSSNAWETLSRMDAWVCNKIEHLGAQRTRSLIHAYARQGRFNGPTAEALLQLVDAYEAENPAPSANGRTSLPAARGSSTSGRDKGLKPLVSRQLSQVDSPRPGMSDEMGEADEAPRSLVLRLIAGVGNAGAGVFRRSGHG